MVRIPNSAAESSGTAKTAEAMLEQYRSFIHTSSEGIWRVELEKPISTKLTSPQQIKLMYKHAFLAEANEAMAAMYGFTSPKQMVGLRLGDLLVESDPTNTAYLDAFIKSGYRLSGVESHEVDKHGNDKYFRNSLVGFTEDGKLLHAWGTQQDVTATHEATEALRLSKERLALAMQVSRMGMWEWDIETGELHWQPELKKLFGLKSNGGVTYDKYLSLIHPDDLKKMKKTIGKAMKTGELYQVEHRIIWPDGTVHWIQSQGQAFFDKGKLSRMLGTARDIDQRVQAEEALQESEQRFRTMAEQQTALVELNDAKDEFISLASHQLRTPATGVKQFIGMLLENYFGELTDDQRTMLEYAYESNERQLEVINDLLKVAQVDAGKVVLSRQKSDLADMLEDIMQEQRAQFARRKQRVVLDRPKAPVFARVDPRRIRMVVENLIDNASKYTPDGKGITVSIDKSQKGKSVKIEVKDQGVGIAKEDISKLFQKFSRLENPLSIQVGGTGIGLYWAKKIVDLHSGTIKLKSKQGKGTVFTVEIPA
jgi:PAS domain S-box-containing protein